MRRCDVLLLGTGPRATGFAPVHAALRRCGLTYRESVSPAALRTVPCRLALVIGCDRIIPTAWLAKAPQGVVILHSSALPYGRGWAPLYHAITERQLRHTVTMFFATAKVDAGQIIATASCAMHPLETIGTLRHKTALMITGLVARYAAALVAGRLTGTPQRGRGSYNRRRTPADSRITPGQKLNCLLPVLRALPEAHPAYFVLRGVRCTLRLTVEEDKIFNPARFRYRIINRARRKL